MKQFLRLPALVIVISLFSFSSSGQYFVDSQYLSTTPTFLLGIVPQITPQYAVDFYRITYNTINTAGDPTIASGSVAIPKTDLCDNFPMAVYCHGTVLRQFDVPSQENMEGFLTKVFASTGFITIAPDYLGLGENPGIHPYVHAESEATATIDLIRATREFLETKDLQDNGEVFVTGYSQGGQAAMATLKYAQDNDLLTELGIAAGAPCSGPYNLSGSQADVLLSDEPYSNPGYVIYLLISYQLAYGNLYSSLSDVIKSPYDTQVEPYFDGAQNQYNMDVVNNMLPNQLSDLLVDSVYFNIQNNPNHPIWINLQDNDTYDWAPQMPVRMYYCTGDEQVPYENSITALETMTANGAQDVDATNVLAGANHGGCVIPALTAAYNFFVSHAQPCHTTGIHELKISQLEVYPNPAKDVLNIVIPEYGGTLYVQSITGRVVLQTKLSQGLNHVNLNKLAASTYIVWFEDESGMLRRTKVVLE